MAIDITTSHYSDGTATVAGVNVTGQGTTWSKVRRGDRFGTHLGFGVRIAEVIDDTHLTLAYDVPGLYQSEAPYEIQRTPNDIGYLQALQDLISMLGNGNLEAFAALNGLTDKLPIFSGPGTLALISKLDLSSGLRSDGRAADQAGLAAFDGEEEGFIVRVENFLDGRAALVEKINNGAPGAWSGPSYVTGEQGGEGPYTDITFGPVTTLEPGVPAYATPVAVGPGEIRIDLSIPKGADGEDGQDGTISGVTPFWQGRLANDADASAALSGLGFTNFWRMRVAGDADAGAALTGLGVTGFMRTVLDDADASTARTTLGAVGLTGTEAIAGAKTFTGLVTANGGGIKFPAVQIASSDANTLDDYEEGTYTPTWMAGATTLSIGNGSLVGTYTKIGRLVSANVSLTGGSTTTWGASGQIWSVSLPFATASNGVAAAMVYGLDAGTAHFSGSATVGGSSSTVTFSSNASGSTWTSAQPFTWTTNDRLYFTMNYITD